MGSIMQSTNEQCVNFSTTFGPVVLQPTTPVTEGCWEIRTTLFVRIVFFYWKTSWDCLVWGGVSLTGPDIGASCAAPKRLQRFWWNFDGIGSRAWSTLWDGWLPPENLVGKNIGEKLFPHVKPMGVLGIFNGDLQKIVHSDLLYHAGY